MEKAISGSPENDESTIRVAHNLKEVFELVIAGFEYVTEMEGAKAFREKVIVKVCGFIRGAGGGI